MNVSFVQGNLLITVFSVTNVLEEDDKIVLRRLSKECSARFRDKLKEIEVENEQNRATAV